jgi:DUF971 family protein
MPPLQPTGYEIHNPQGQFELRWSDGTVTHHSLALLRRLCPCATCRTEREKMQAKGPVLRVIKEGGPSPESAQAESVTPVGRYALNFRWNDGHNTGIYSYEFLQQHAEKEIL